ncbi:hypothetical protein C8R43DRAFT_943551 [Mycena crocata]|nr:hypothetical protein C8R43DRAFT_943551 [Mycena crocata]
MAAEQEETDLHVKTAITVPNFLHPENEIQRNCCRRDLVEGWMDPERHDEQVTEGLGEDSQGTRCRKNAGVLVLEGTSGGEDGGRDKTNLLVVERRKESTAKEENNFIGRSEGKNWFPRNAFMKLQTCSKAEKLVARDPRTMLKTAEKEHVGSFVALRQPNLNFHRVEWTYQNNVLPEAVRRNLHLSERPFRYTPITPFDTQDSNIPPDLRRRRWAPGTRAIDVPRNVLSQQPKRQT